MGPQVAAVRKLQDGPQRLTGVVLETMRGPVKQLSCPTKCNKNYGNLRVFFAPMPPERRRFLILFGGYVNPSLFLLIALFPRQGTHVSFREANYHAWNGSPNFLGYHELPQGFPGISAVRMIQDVVLMNKLVVFTKFSPRNGIKKRDVLFPGFSFSHLWFVGIQTPLIRLEAKRPLKTILFIGDLFPQHFQGTITLSSAWLPGWWKKFVFPATEEVFESWEASCPETQVFPSV